MYLLTPWCRVFFEKLTGLQLVKKFPAFHGTRRFITALTSVCHQLSTHLCLGLPSGLFPSGFRTKTLYTPLSSPIRATCSAHLILLHFITRTILGEQYKSFSSSLCSNNNNNNCREDGSSNFLRNVDINIPVHTASYPRGLIFILFYYFFANENVVLRLGASGCFLKFNP